MQSAAGVLVPATAGAVQGIIQPAVLPNTTVDTIQSPLAEQLTNLTARVATMNTKLDAAINLGSTGGVLSSSSTNSTLAVGPVVYTLDDDSLSTIPKTFEISNRTNIMDAWRMWWIGSKRCGEQQNENVRPFKDININHFEYTANSKKNKNSWLVWRQVVGYLTSKLDELKNNNTYDWSAADPVAPRTLMFVAQLVPAAPHREGVRKRRVLPSKNSVGTVRKNISLLR